MDRQSLSEADIEALIKMVEERPSIWDKSCNKDPAEKKKAWREIFEYFSRSKWDIEWKDMHEKDQRKFEQELTGKWINLRDTFTKLVKRRREQTYRHYELLKFFIRNIEVDPVPSTSADKLATPRENGSKSHTVPFKRIKKPSSPLRIDSKKRKRLSFGQKTFKTKTLPNRWRIVPPVASVPSPSPQFGTYTVASVPSPQFLTNTVAAVPSPQFLTNDVSPTPQPNHKNNVNVLDEDEAFFISVMPSVKKMSDEDKLEFRIGVLSVLQKITTSALS